VVNLQASNALLTTVIVFIACGCVIGPSTEITASRAGAARLAAY